MMSRRDFVVLNGVTGIFSNIPLVVNEWSPDTANIRPDLSAMPLWIELKQVPGSLYSCKGLSFFC